jgi:chromosome segregation ATPase
MSQEKYVEYYVDIMSKTLQDSIVKSISLQANLKLTENVIRELQTKIEELTSTVNSTKQELESTKTIKNSSDNARIQQLQNENNEHVKVINTLRSQLNDLSVVKSEYESVKHQLQHVDTFRNELSKSREELESVHGKYGSEIEALKKEHENAIKELNDQIDYLKLTPAKRKKIDEAKAAQVTVDGADLEELIISDEILKDGGSF